MPAPARLFAGMAELGVGDAEQLGERLSSLRREMAVGSQVRLDDLRRALLREIDDRLGFVAQAQALLLTLAADRAPKLARVHQTFCRMRHFWPPFGTHGGSKAPQTG